MRVLAAGEEGVVFVADLRYLKQTALGADIGLLEIFNAVDDIGAGSTGDAVIVRLANAADGGDVSFDEVVLCKVYLVLVGSLHNY